MIWIVVVLYALAAVLPFIGLARVLTEAERYKRRVRAETSEVPAPIEAETTEQSFDDYLVRMRQRMSKQAASSAWGDIALIGSGLACGAIASIWSLFL